MHLICCKELKKKKNSNPALDDLTKVFEALLEEKQILKEAIEMYPEFMY